MKSEGSQAQTKGLTGEKTTTSNTQGQQKLLLEGWSNDVSLEEWLTREPHELPRERLERLGPKALSDQDLLSIILSSGGRDRDVFSLSKSVERKLDEIGSSPSLHALLDIPGIGPAKASALVASFEFSRRRIISEGVKIRSPVDIIPLISHLADRKQETFICVSLSGAHEVIASRIVTVGLANLCQVHPREVFADPLVDRACSIIVAHNHPSGELTPSEEDKQVTSRLQDAARILGLKFLDHIIFSRRGYYSIICKEIFHC